MFNLYIIVTSAFYLFFFREFLDGSRQYKRSSIAQRKYQEARPKAEVEDKINGSIAADPGGEQSRFSTSFRPQLKTGDDFVDSLRTVNSTTNKMSKSIEVVGNTTYSNKLQTLDEL